MKYILSPLIIFFSLFSFASALDLTHMPASEAQKVEVQDKSLTSFQVLISKKLDQILSNMIQRDGEQKTYTTLRGFRLALAKLSGYHDKMHRLHYKIRILDDIVKDALKDLELKLYYTPGSTPTIKINNDNKFFYNGIETYLVASPENSQKYNLCRNGKCNIQTNIGFEQAFPYEQAIQILPHYRAISLSGNEDALLYNEIKYMYNMDNTTGFFRYFEKILPDFYTAENNFSINGKDSQVNVRYRDGDDGLHEGAFVFIQPKKAFAIENITNTDTGKLTGKVLESILRQNIDMEQYQWNTKMQDILSDIVRTTEKVIAGKKTDKAKLQAIYTYIVNNVSYDYDLYNHYLSTKNIPNGQYDSFNAFGTFDKKKGVCTGYSSLFQLMASIAGIQDVEVVTGYYYDSSIQQPIAHAWNKRGNTYYDLTFENGNGFKDTTQLYFALPEDVIMMDRAYNGEKAVIKKLQNDKKFALSYVQKKRQKALKKYGNMQLLQPEKVFRQNGITEKMSLDEIFSKLEEVYTYYSEDSGIDKVTEIQRKEDGTEKKRTYRVQSFAGFGLTNTASLYNLYYSKEKIPHTITLMKNLYNDTYTLVTRMQLY